MPNWCECSLRVRGPSTELRKWLDAVRAHGKTLPINEGKECFTFDYDCPVPKELEYDRGSSLFLAKELLTGDWKKIWAKHIKKRIPGRRPRQRKQAIRKFRAHFGNTDAHINLQEAYKARDLKEKYGADCGYDYRCRYWGVKWDVDEPHINDILDHDHEDSEIDMSFSTPWGPPCGWACIASEKNPSFTFTLEYGEPGMDFAGTIVFKEGDCIEDNQTTYFEKYPNCYGCGDGVDSIDELEEIRSQEYYCESCAENQREEIAKEELEKRRKKQKAETDLINKTRAALRDGEEEVARKLSWT